MIHILSTLATKTSILWLLFLLSPPLHSSPLHTLLFFPSSPRYLTTPLSSFGMNFAESDAQRGSPFFTKLPPEIRRQIFINLFGGSRVHVVFSNHKNKSFRREDQPKGPFPRFYHCVCRHQNDAPPHKLHEGNHKRRYLSTHILFTCKWA